MSIVTRMLTNEDNGSVHAGEYEFIGGSTLQALLPSGFDEAWTREEHEQIVASQTLHLTTTKVPESRRGLFDYQMQLLFAIPGISSVEVRVGQNRVQVTTRFADEQVLSLDQIHARILRALHRFDNAF